MSGDGEPKKARRDFDPRFDPVFQRGYRAQPGERARTRVRTGEQSAPPVVPPPRPPAPTIAPPEPALAPVSSAPDMADTAPEPAPVPAPTLLDGLARFDVSPRRNPAMRTLWLVSSGLVALGIAVYCVSVALSYSGETPSSDVGVLVLSQLGWMLAGPLVTVGVAALMALVFLTVLVRSRLSAAGAEQGDEDRET